MAQYAQNHSSWAELYNLVEMAEEFAAVIRNELDYLREGRHAEQLHENFAQAEYVHVPTIYWEYTTRRILVMERLDGIKIDDVDGLNAAGYDCREVAQRATRFVFKEILEDGFFHGDPHPGNYVVLPGTVIGVMDFGKVGYLDDRDRFDLTLMFIALIQMDASGLVDQMIRLNFVGRDVDRTALEHDLSRVLRQYAGVPLHDIRITELVNVLVTIIFRHRLRLPADFILLLQTLSMMEATAIKLEPDFDIFAVSEPYVRRFKRQLWLPSKWGPEALRGAVGLADAFTRFPQQTVRLLGQLENGELSVQIRMPELPTALHELDRIANQLSVTVLIAAFIIAVARLIPLLDLNWPWSIATWLVMVAFAFVSLAGLWLLWRIIRSD
ncbi:hypothetical protein KFU94_25950 [Chloroflexi bacterium TSY]|nr:hypothetical protein [Chloroflexi bacterium TSY]